MPESFRRHGRVLMPGHAQAGSAERSGRRVWGLALMATDHAGAIMSAALACAADGLTRSAGRVALYPGGEVAWDQCDCDGQVWVRLAGMERSGDGDRTSTPCGPLLWRATLGVGVIRCVASIDEQGKPPNVAQLTADTLQMSQDMSDLAVAMTCCLASQIEDARLQLLSWTPVGPQGGCSGGEWTVSVLVNTGP